MTATARKSMPYMGDEQPKTKVGQGSPFLSDLGSRINEVAAKVGGAKVLADMAGISESQMHRYIAGTSEATVSKLVAIAKYGGVSVAWLTGERPVKEQIATDRLEIALDLPRLMDAVETVEAGLQAAHRNMKPRPKAELVALVYQALEEEDTPTKLLRLVKDVIARTQQQSENAL
ncbi:Helix-turn-helix [Methylomagnum ishizawai]|uniref:Helix-turn-helix n=1 Tax=Methylomagnum ishizawai TaxID=1760988 RepID=A0A1Y6CVH7_9GAMM|nr:helix-turn-helix transcriptional regulator [Methylomagnum ishizawai]SMF94337.1 Helix-turn-helix [Methylomagnum ishizawai]